MSAPASPIPPEPSRSRRAPPAGLRAGRNPDPGVLLVEDDSGLRTALCETLALAGFSAEAVADGSAALEALDGGHFGLVVSDVQMSPMDGLALLHAIRSTRPELPVLLMTAFGTIQQAVDAMRHGAVDYLVKPFEAEVLAGKVSHYFRGAAPPSRGADAVGLIAAAPASRELAKLAERVAASDVTVMISGESGTGKEVLARYVHACSPRAAGPFVALNCAAIPENMLEAMLFGYEKGAFTGAYKACPGKFEQAEGGTLLLDEISEMALGLQAKLLRVLQEREVERLGGRAPIALDVRVIATTNRELAAIVADGRFREDLYYRLNVFPLHASPLRERPADIGPLAEHLLGRAARAAGQAPVRLEPEALAALTGYLWPGNVRELDNVLQRALVLGQGGWIAAADLAFADLGSAALGFEGGPGRSEGAAARAVAEAAPIPPDGDRDSLGDALRIREHRVILDALAQCGGSRRAVAAKLGISARTLRYKLARMRDAGVAVR